MVTIPPLEQVEIYEAILCLVLLTIASVNLEQLGLLLFTMTQFENFSIACMVLERFIKVIDDELSRSDYNALLMRMGFKEVDDLSPLFEDVNDKNVDVNLANSGLTDMQLELTCSSHQCMVERARG